MRRSCRPQTLKRPPLLPAHVSAPRGHENFEHTADVGIRAWGPTLDAAFEEAALGLVGNMIELSEAREVGEARLEVEGENVERLLFRFLDELLDLVQSRLWIVARVQVALHGDTRLTATLWGEAFDKARHGHIHEIKAITFHDMAIQRAPPEVRVIVDI